MNTEKQIPITDMIGLAVFENLITATELRKEAYSMALGLKSGTATADTAIRTARLREHSNNIKKTARQLVMALPY